MTADGPNAATGQDTTNAGCGDSEEAPRVRRDDAFVVRLWRDATTSRLLRAEVEHLATGELTRAVGPAPGWVLARIRACLEERPLDDGGAQAGMRRARPPPRPSVLPEMR